MRVDQVTLDNAADVVTGWVGNGVTAVCAQSDEIACLVLYGIHQARLRCPSDLAVMGVDASPMGMVSTPPLTTVNSIPARSPTPPSPPSSSGWDNLPHPPPSRRTSPTWWCGRRPERQSAGS